MMLPLNCASKMQTYGNKGKLLDLARMKLDDVGYNYVKKKKSLKDICFKKRD